MLGHPVDVVSAGAVAPAPAADPVVTGYAGLLAEVLAVDSVDPGAHVFDDLGADSMVMARFCARVRKRADLPAVSIKDVYAHPTLRALASALAPAPAADPVASGLAEVLAEVLQVDTVDPGAHVFDDLGADSMLMARFCARVRKRADLPTVSIKDVYRHPTLTGLAGALAPATAPSPVRDGLAAVLAEVLQVDTVDPDAHVFDDLGADSMVMARFCARVRKHPDLPAVSIKDVYAHPTLRALAAALAPTTAAPPAAPAVEVVRAPAATAHPASTVEYVLCGTLQLLFFLLYSYFTAWFLVTSYGWISAAVGVVDQYLRSALFGAVAFTALCSLSIAAKWLLIGRWEPQDIRIWSLSYFRFWVVKSLVRSNPLVLFNGSPLYNLYLRALGAKIGRGVVILSRSVPVATDLLTVGDGTVIRKGAAIACYRAHGSVIQTGPITLGRDVVVSEVTVLDIETSMGDGAQLGMTSSLHAGQSVPAGESWHGSPARRTDVDYHLVEPMDVGPLRAWLYSIGQVLMLLLVYLPLVVGGVDILLASSKAQELLLSAPVDMTGWAFYADALLFSAVLFFGAMAVSLLVICTWPRLLAAFVVPDRVYPLFGVRYTLHRTVTRMTNSVFFTNLFGDSSYIVPFLRALGYRLTPVVQTGSNFGTAIVHETPYQVSVGTGTVIASEFTVLNAQYSSTSFKVSRASIGKNNFFGNMVAYPSAGRTGDDCLLATKVAVPIEGPVRSGVGLLGSPAFEIPRTVERDTRFDHLRTDEELPGRLAAKNRHNLTTMGLLLLSRWFATFVITVIGFRGIDLYPVVGLTAIALASLLVLVFTICYGVLVERASTGFRPLRPKYCSIYDIDFWRTERFFKLEAQVPPFFNGTPFKSLIWRALGVRLGKRLFDDGAQMAEKSIVTIGDHVTLNANAWMQCHSQEDYVFKSDRITIGSGCTIGAGAMVFYRAEMHDGSVLEPDSFLMKGEEVPAAARWGGNPAVELDPIPAPLPVPTPRPELGTDDGDRAGQDARTVEDLMELFRPDDGTPPIPVPRRGGRHRATQRHLAGSR